VSEHLSKDEFLAHIGPMRESLARLVEFQREQNGRVGKAETRLAVLEERTPPSRLETNGLSAIISAVISGVGMWLSAQK
jgi:DNA-binding transcriptional LysR family regulator